MLRSLKFSFLAFLFLIAGCSPSTVQEYQHQVEGKVKLLLSDLKKIETKEDLVRERSGIEKKMLALVDLMIQLHKMRQDHLCEKKFDQLNISLLNEFKRIYQIEGARQLMEEYQREALLKLDSYDQSL